jgi:hypothetical protein
VVEVGSDIEAFLWTPRLVTLPAMGSQKRAETRPQWPRFREREVVRIVRLEEWNRHRDRLGLIGTVTGSHPAREERGWVTVVEFSATDDYDHYSEDQLESTGLLEVDDERGPLRDRHGDPVAHVPLPEIDPVDYWPELIVSALSEISEEPVESLLARAKARVAEILPSADVDAIEERDAEYPACWRVTLTIRSADASRENFERLVASYDHWQQEFDDGWGADFSWWRTSAEPGVDGFILPEAHSVFVELSPWNDPSYRPVPAGRNRGLEHTFVYGSFLPSVRGYE